VFLVFLVSTVWLLNLQKALMDEAEEMQSRRTVQRRG